MQQYILRRLLISIPTLVGITILIFVALRVIPGDPISSVFGSEGFMVLSEADQERFRDSLGLNDPLPVQYLSWMKDVVKGDFGYSFWSDVTIRETLLRRGPISAEIGIIAIIISWLIGIPAGILSAIRRNTGQDYITRLFTIIFLAVPGFWVGILIMLASVLWFRWRPPLELYQIWDNPWGNLQIVLGPSIVLGLGASAYIARFCRSSMLEVLREDYVRTAHAKGLAESIIVYRHVLKNALIPVVTATGLLLGGLLGGAVAVEQAFTVPGLGTKLVDALHARDYTVIQTLVLLYGFVFLVINLLVDITYGFLDPRIVYR
tara:strand:- start:310 stop:1266 length:957 start_codon:yes stop_codon:yes gene_type:complete